MNSQTYELMVNSLMRPQGLFEIYDSSVIGHHHWSRIDALESCSRMDKDLIQGYGLAIGYGIHQDTIRLQLIATSYDSFPIVRDAGKPLRTLRAPNMLQELARFSYGHKETTDLSHKILHGEDAGPLEHEILREMKAKDPQFNEVRATIDGYMGAIGSFAEEMALRGLSID